MRTLLLTASLAALLVTSAEAGAKPLSRKRMLSMSGGNTSGLFFGPLYGRYQYHMSGPEIYMWRKNNGYLGTYGTAPTDRQLEIKDPFGDINNFYGWTLGFNGEALVNYSLLWQHQRSVSDIKYTYDTGPGTGVYNYSQKVKMTINWVSFAMGIRVGAKEKIFLGGSIDIGMLKTVTKIDDEGNPNGSGKWQPWFYSFKVLGSGITPRTPVAAVSVIASYDIGPLTLRYSHNWGILNGDLNSETNKYTNIPWSSKFFPVAANTIALTYNLSN